MIGKNSEVRQVKVQTGWERLAALGLPVCQRQEVYPAATLDTRTSFGRCVHQKSRQPVPLCPLSPLVA